MSWTPLPRLAFAICTYPFVPTSSADLPLQIGDELYIIEQGGRHGAWYRGYLVAPPSLLAGLTSTKGQTLEKRVYSGIFPRDCVDVRELLGSITEHRRAPKRHAAFDSENEATDGDLEERQPVEDATSSLDAEDEKSYVYRPPRPDLPVSPQDDEEAAMELRRLKDVTSTLANRNISTRDSPSTTSRLKDSGKPLAPVPMLKIGDESVLTKQEPLVDEIASCLREWHSSKLHELLLGRKYGAIEHLSTLVTRLDYARRQLLHKILTQHELERLRDSAVWDLVRGNKVLGGDTIVRSTAARGRIMTSDDSAVEISQLQSLMSLLDERPVAPPERSALYHLLVDLKSFAFLDAPKSSTLSLSLYLVGPGGIAQLISETYEVEVPFRDPDGLVFDGPARTLFSDVSGLDVGEGSNDGQSIYLVVRLITSEPTLPPNNSLYESPVMLEGHSRQPSSSNSASLKGGTVKSGRRSLLWSQLARKDLENNVLVPPERPFVPPSRVTSPRPATSPNSSRKSQKQVKRMTGIGILDVTGTIKGVREREQSIELASPGAIDNNNPENQTAWKILVSHVTGDLKLQFGQSHAASVLSSHLKAFKSPNSETLIQSTPTLLHGITSSRRNAFPGAPTKPRSDIYVTVTRPYLPRNAHLSHPRTGNQAMSYDNGLRNLRLTLEVHDASEKRIDNCVYPSSNSAGVSAWRTVAVESDELWNQTVRLAINTEDVPGSHIVMSIADAPAELPFALCWIPLWTQGAFVQDGEHSLVLYKYDEYTSSQGAYLSLPWSISKAKDESVTGPVASLRMSTNLCSTTFSQNPKLLALLNWREQRAKGVGAILRQFPFIPDIEVVKLINEVLDSLFEIMVENAGIEETEDLVFGSLLILLSIVQDRRFNLQPLIDQYTQARFRWPFAFPCMFRSFTRLLKEPMQPESARKLRSACKVGAHLFQFMIRARQQQIEKEVEIGIKSHPPTFAKDLRGIFIATEELMRNPNPVLVGTKTIVVQNFHNWLPQLSSVTNAEEILHLATGFVDACSDSQGKLILYKLVLIRHLTAANIFNADSLYTWQSQVARWLYPYWGLADNYTLQWREQIRLCCSIVSTLSCKNAGQKAIWIKKLVESFKAIQMLPLDLERPFSPLFPTSYPFPIKVTKSREKYDEALIEITALLAPSTVLPSDAFMDLPDDELQDLLLAILGICQSILNLEVFPRSWLSVYIYHHKTVLRMLESIFQVLCERFLPVPDDAGHFNDALWKSYLSTLLALVASDALALETFPEQKQQAIWKIGGDVRELGAELLRRSWLALGWENSVEEKLRLGLEKMGGYQIPYVPALVGPVLELCLSVHQGLRGVAISILHTMIVGEWTLNQDLSAIQTEMINELDKLYREKPLNDGMMQKQFIDELYFRIEPIRNGPERPLFSAVTSLLERISELLDLLVAIYLREAAGDLHQVSDTLRLLEYLAHLGKTDIYIGYVHKLAASQLESDQPTEAALALKMHADLYDWEPGRPVEALKDPSFPAQSSFERKERIYFDIINHFENGHAWSHALEAYRDLAKQYEYQVFDFAKLARAQRSIATVHETISREERRNPRYFRVIYRGLGFPPSLREKQFIFEGFPSDRLVSFTDRMQRQYPSAQVVSGGALDEVEGQYLSVYSISVQRDYSHPVNRQARVPQPIKDHYALSFPSRFSVTSRRQNSTSGIKDQMQDKIVYTTAEVFPTILRRSEIVHIQTVRMNPAQIGLDRTNRKTQELHSSAAAISRGKDTAVAGLTDNLTNLVNAKSAACVAGYWELVASRNQPSNELDAPMAQRPTLEEEALRVALIDHVFIIEKCLELYTRAAHQATRAELSKGMRSCHRSRIDALTNFSELGITFAPVIAAMDRNSSKPEGVPEPASVQEREPSPQLEQSHTVARRPKHYSLYPSEVKPKASQQRPNGALAADGRSRLKEGRPTDSPVANASHFSNSQSRDSNDSRNVKSPQPRIIGRDETGIINRQASLQGLQTRMGSVTKRLSALNMGRKGNKGSASLKSPNIERVAED